MLGSIFGGLIGSGLSSAINYGISSAQMDKQFKHQQELMLQQNEYALSNWKKEREYNEELYNKYYSPSAMRKQYKDANLNPAALAGTSVQSVGDSNLASPGLGSASGANPVQFGFDPLSAMQAHANIEKTKAETKNIQSQTYERDSLLAYRQELIDAEGVSQRIKNDIDSITLSITQATAETEIALKKQELLEGLERISALKYENAEKAFNNAKLSDRYDLWRDKTLLEIAQISADIVSIDYGVQLTAEQIKNTILDRELMAQAIDIADVDEDLKKELLELQQIENDFARANKWAYFIINGGQAAAKVADVISTVATRGKFANVAQKTKKTYKKR